MKSIFAEYDITMKNIRDNIGKGNLNHDYILQTLLEEYPERFSKAIAKYQKTYFQDRSKLDFSLRSEHEEWFRGTEKTCKTKEEAMGKRAQDRIRGYYYKTKEEIIKSDLYETNEKARQMFHRILDIFRYLLIGCNYFSMMFDRKCKRKHPSLQDQTDASALPSKRMRQMIKEYATRTEMFEDWSVSLCNDSGEFFCQGLYSNTGGCDKGHSINPYICRENLLVFQVWNLDHQIELARTIVPSLIENVRSLLENPNQKCPLHGKKVKDVNIIEYFLELFSVKNLKLVYIVCHDKTQRKNSSNGRLVCDKCSEYNLIKDFTDFTESIDC